MDKKELTDKEVLRSIRDKDFVAYDLYVNLLMFVTRNAEHLGDLDIMGSTEIEITEDGVSEKKMFMAEKRIVLMTKFSEKYEYYKNTLEKLRLELGEELVSKAEKEIQYRSKSGLSLEERMSKGDK